MAFNILISIVILKQQTKLTVFFNFYYENNENQAEFYEKDLLVTLNAYRNIYLKESLNQVKLNSSLRNKLFKINSTLSPQTATKDYLFDRDVIIKDLFSQSTTKAKKTYLEPKLLINNEQICHKSNDNILITILIHSHRNNYIRRKAMRDTWLTLNQINIFDLFNSIENYINENDLKKLISINKKQIEIVHLFVIGKQRTYSQTNQSDEYLQSFQTIKKENDIHKDILMVDIVEDYKNLIYKHLAIVNWVVKYCSSATYIIKLDDDVFVNIKPLSKHLISHLGLNYINSKFMFCNIVEKGKPSRQRDSKWFVSYNTYPFDYYPRYCEGFSYITNVPTMKLMYHQAKMIPRFWIDDVYVSGLLLYGFQRIEWFNYKNYLPVSVYNFWDFETYTNKIYSSVLSWFNYYTVDFYKSDFFVILHHQDDNKEVNYDIVYDENINSTGDSNHYSTSSKFYNFCKQLFRN